MKYSYRKISELVFNTGQLNISDPLYCDDPKFKVSVGAKGEIYFISRVSDLLGLSAVEISFCPTDHCPRYAKEIGVIGVDSANIAIADRGLGDVTEEILELLNVSPDNARRVREDLRLDVRRLSDTYYEILDCQLEQAYGRLREYFDSTLKLPAEEHVLYYRDWEYFILDRIDFADDESVNVPLGNFEFFVFSPNGSDGRYKIIANTNGEEITRCWVILDDQVLSSSPSDFHIDS